MAQDAARKNIASNGYALLVGVESYRAFDPGGARDLKAGWNDVLSFWTFCLRAGFALDEVQVLVSPAPRTARDSHAGAERPFLHGHRERQAMLAKDGYLDLVRKHPLGEDERKTLDASFGESPVLAAARGERAPTKKAILEELAILAARGKQRPEAPILFVYSGHGARDANGELLLCPEDVDPSLEGAIPFSEVAALLGEIENATVILDCCDVLGGGDDDGDATCLRSSTVARNEAAMKAFKGRILCASTAGEAAHQAVFDAAQWRSVFSWSLVNHLWRFRIKRAGALLTNTITHGELIERVAEDLKEWDQTPMLVSRTPNPWDLRLFQAGAQPIAGAPERSGKTRRGQLQPDAKYRILLGSKAIGEVFVVGANRTWSVTLTDGTVHTLSGGTRGREHWYFDCSSTALANLKSAADVTINYTSIASVWARTTEVKASDATAAWGAADKTGPRFSCDAVDGFLWSTAPFPAAPVGSTVVCFTDASIGLRLVAGTSDLVAVQWMQSTSASMGTITPGSGGDVTLKSTKDPVTGYFWKASKSG